MAVCLNEVALTTGVLAIVDLVLGLVTVDVGCGLDLGIEEGSVLAL